MDGNKDLYELDDEILRRDWDIWLVAEPLCSVADTKNGIVQTGWLCTLHNEFDGGALIYRGYKSTQEPDAVDIVAGIYRKVEGIYDRSYFDWCGIMLLDPEQVSAFETYRKAWELYKDWRYVFPDITDISGIDGIEEYI